jgi:pantoate--beta-alanine ligase
MMLDLNFDLESVGCPIVREADGLAMSSRNRFLSAEERRQALVIARSLRAGCDLAASGETSAQRLIDAMHAVMATEPAVRVDYISVVDRDTLEDIDDIRSGGMLAIAALAGTTRLIDNMLIEDGE